MPTVRCALRPVNPCISLHENKPRTAKEVALFKSVVRLLLATLALYRHHFRMPHRRLVQIGKPAPLSTAPLPTVAEYFRDLAQRQGEDIRLLKEHAAEREAERRTRRKSVREEGWRLHPVVVKTAKKKPSPKRAKAKRPASRKRTRATRRSH
jgi:hypothetical protein